jgi:DNA-binding MarR family transcriptional regulator
MPVNRPQTASSPTASADGRLYLRDQDLDQGAALIRAAARRLAQLAETVGGSPALSGPELDILLEIHDRGPTDVTELRSRLGAPKQSMARNLNALESSGIVARLTSQQDRRRRLVTLTPEGMAFARRATERRREALRRAFLSAGPDAVTGARRVLSELSQGGER